ncbi:hypothetical protein BKA70DRAFT_1437048 [Coprinopsis sp. MPI-PUGE-AT-0042]|nr:hypothetical protein BKA70DRAFT_1437048 [Coprinopsis sp. MPI-PUGE-AT-0042]
MTPPPPTQPPPSPVIPQELTFEYVFTGRNARHMWVLRGPRLLCAFWDRLFPDDQLGEDETLVYIEREDAMFEIRMAMINETVSFVVDDAGFQLFFDL